MIAATSRTRRRGRRASRRRRPSLRISRDAIPLGVVVAARDPGVGLDLGERRSCPRGTPGCGAASTNDGEHVVEVAPSGSPTRAIAESSRRRWSRRCAPRASRKSSSSSPVVAFVPPVRQTCAEESSRGRPCRPAPRGRRRGCARCRGRAAARGPPCRKITMPVGQRRRRRLLRDREGRQRRAS